LTPPRTIDNYGQIVSQTPFGLAGNDAIDFQAVNTGCVSNNYARGSSPSRAMRSPATSHQVHQGPH